MYKRNWKREVANKIKEGDVQYIADIAIYFRHLRPVTAEVGRMSGLMREARKERLDNVYWYEWSLEEVDEILDLIDKRYEEIKEENDGLETQTAD